MRWIGTRFDTDIHDSLVMYPTDSDNPPIFFLWHHYEVHVKFKLLYCHVHNNYCEAVIDNEIKSQAPPNSAVSSVCIKKSGTKAN